MRVFPMADLKLGSTMTFRTSRAMATASPNRFLSLSTRRPRKHANETRLADRAIMAIKESVPLIKRGTSPDHEKGIIRPENKKIMHTQEVKRAPLKPHLHAAARTTNK